MYKKYMCDVNCSTKLHSPNIDYIRNRYNDNVQTVTFIRKGMNIKTFQFILI